MNTHKYYLACALVSITFVVAISQSWHPRDVNFIDVYVYVASAHHM